MAFNQLNTTTITPQIGVGDNDFAVGSTANIAIGNMLVIAGTQGQEAVKVQDIPVSGRVKVSRGWAGTIARPAAAGTTVYIGTPDQFKWIKDTAAAIVGDSALLPVYLVPGQRAKDGNGNEYILVDLTFTAFNGIGVLISKDGLYTATAFASGGAGSVGILCEEGTSGQCAWAQIYGAKAYVQYTSGSSLMTSTGIIAPATSASVPVGAFLGRTTSQATSDPALTIYGMFPSSAVTTATTAATSATGFQGSVWLNYPYMLRANST